MTLLELLGLLKRNLKLVILFPILFAVAAYGFAYGMLTDTYTASTTLYVLADNDDNGNTSLNTTLSGSQLVSNDIASLITSSRVMDTAAEKLGLTSLAGFSVSVQSQTTNRVISLAVSGKDPEAVADVANAMATSVSKLAQEIMSVKSVNIVDKAQVPLGPSGPNRPMYVAVGFLAGLFFAVAFVVLKDMLNTKIKSGEEAEQLLGLPVIGQFPVVKKA